MDSWFVGTHETQECFEDDDKLTYYPNCKKKQGHDLFLPARDLTPSCLPQRYHGNVYEVVRYTAQLTVMVVTYVISPGRINTHPRTGRPYPYSNLTIKKLSRKGSGRIYKIKKITEEDNQPCPCGMCIQSGKPVMTWGEIRIVTATHLVFDDYEAQNTVCRFGYDQEDSPIILLTGVGLESADVDADRCKLICVTHDVNLVEELEVTWGRYYDLVRSVRDEFKDIRDEDKVTVVVSHPHGGPKMVTVGEWVYREDGEGRTCRYCYTASTCPGSSGACVYVVGREGWYYAHVHSGTGGKGNFSGYGVDY
ncbi:uncharacterized protein LOC131956301 [Physella acuta]|uniref:uncharacterized protein LOC131956301 n=1 Tax=Physella acuta TaxID=109671 RepID=UPI0027DC1C43|nr:uncharacterized protein LOC131956301 [Physella acuta]